ncbi:MAG: hypothetical protein HUJ25_14045 [Crocinitomicaceae bacterium]|nr:hypothetical protein [Crocinitomicaceae bacterium]
MSIQEKKVLVNIFGSLLIFGSYCYYVFGLNGEENLAEVNDIKFWAFIILSYIPIIIVAKVIIYIVFLMINKAVTDEDDPGFEDEFDKLIQLKAERNGNFIFYFGFIAGFAFIALDYPLWTLFACMAGSGLISEITSELWKFYFYRKGI